jgi:hypothetical protein
MVGSVRALGRTIDRGFNPRLPGSQEEFLTAGFLLAHMAKLGYMMRLDSVPVANTVDSANVEATVREGDPHPSVVVVVGYDSPASGSHQGPSLGEWLEVARAVQVKGAPGGLEMVALGAEHARTSGGQLGSRRLAQVLLNAHSGPQIITIGTIDGPGFSALGPDAPKLDRIARGLGVSVERDAIPGPTAKHPDVWAEAGFHHTTVAGGARAVGDVLVRFLTARSTASAPG